jgi:hypothetical protein
LLLIMSTPVTPPNPPLDGGRLEAAHIERERDEKRENDGAAVRTLCVVYICGPLIR